MRITEKIPTKLRKSGTPYKSRAWRVLSQIFEKRQNPKNDKSNRYGFAVFLPSKYNPRSLEKIKTTELFYEAGRQYAKIIILNVSFLFAEQ